MRFGCPRSLTSDQGAHFISSTIATLKEYFLIQHHKSSPYHPQANGIVEAFNKIWERGLTKICCTNCEDWDDIFPVVLWAYMTKKNNPQIYTIPFSLRERSSGACRIYHPKFIYCTSHTYERGGISGAEA
jgi:transposase InsO family protein